MRQRKRRFTRPSFGEMEEFQEFLGPELASQYNESELKQLRADMHAMAEILLDLYMEKKRDGSNPAEVKHI